MEKETNILLGFFIFVMLITLAGFFNSYLRFFPDFSKFPLIIHVHFTAFTLWLMLLVTQPLLIRQKKYYLHRQLGRLSYFLAPVLIITIIILNYHQIKRNMQSIPQQAPMTAFIAVLDVLSFDIYYIITMVNRRHIRWHIAFLIASTLVILNPGLSRLLNQIEWGLGMIAAIIIPFVISILIICIEKFKYKRSILKSPYSLYLLL